MGSPLHAYIVISLLTGARTEELRPLTWSLVDLDGAAPHMMVWRPVRAGGDTKTRKSRRTIALPARCVSVLREQRALVLVLKADAGVPIERISHLVGHSGTSVTEAVYRKQIRPVITEGAEVMDRIFPRNSPERGEATPDA